MVMADERVKLVVFLLLDVVLVPRPDGLNGVEPFAVQLDGKRHKARVSLNDPLDCAGLRELLRIVFEFQRDLGAARQIGGGREVVTAGAPRSSIASPVPAARTTGSAPSPFSPPMNAE